MKVFEKSGKFKRLEKDICREIRLHSNRRQPDFEWVFQLEKFFFSILMLENSRLKVWQSLKFGRRMFLIKY